MWAGVLTTLPGLCFAGAGLASAVLSRRFGLGRSISLALATLIVGLLVRVLDGPYVVIGGTLVATAGIAVVNVLIPVVIKQSFPTQLGLMTGVYTAALQGGGALGSAVTPPLENIYGGWRPALGAWAVLAVVALVIWLVAAGCVEGPSVSAESGERRRSLIRNPLAWTVTLFFGTQSLLAYIMMGWLPEVFIDNGVSKTSAGLLVGLLSVIAVPISLVLAPMAARSAHQSGWIAALGMCGFAGVVGLLIAPDFSPLLWSVLVGIGMSVFSLAFDRDRVAVAYAGGHGATVGHGEGLRLSARRHRSVPIRHAPRCDGRLDGAVDHGARCVRGADRAGRAGRSQPLRVSGRVE